MDCHDAVTDVFTLSELMVSAAGALERRCGHDACLVLSGMLREYAARSSEMASKAGLALPERRTKINGHRHGLERRRRARW